MWHENLMTRIIEWLADVSDDYDGVFCDVWGVIHNGLVPNIDSCQALNRAIGTGVPVLLLTNSPRRAADVERQIGEIGVPEDCWNFIVTSGDSARDALFRGEVGKRLFHIGPDSAKSFLSPDFGSNGNPREIECVGFNEAEGIVCTGLFDDTAETPDDYRSLLADAVKRGMKLLCANPDIVVDRGSKRLYCAGALAVLFEELGGKSLMFGKPRRRIYDLAKRRLRAMLPDISNPRILCIGDGITTDIAGAENQSLDSLFVTGGLAAEETATIRQPDPEKLRSVLDAAGVNPKFAIGHLR